MSEEITLARYRNTDYTIRCEIDGSEKRYKWKGSQGNKIDKKKVPQEVVDWLNMNSQCFSKGALVVEEDKEKEKEITEDFADVEDYNNNTHSYDDIVKLLKGNYKKLEKELNNTTVDDEKRYIVDIAKEIQDELTGGKQKLIANWYGQEQDILFS